MTDINHSLVQLNASCIAEWLEFFILVNAWYYERAVLLLLYVAGVEELLDERGSGFTLSLLGFHHLDLRLQSIIVRQPGLVLLFLNELSLLVIFDLLLSPAPLAAGLQEVRGDALVR